MLYKELYLEDYFPLPDVGQKTKATLYIPSVSGEFSAEKRFPCVIVCPGGGYSFTSDREAEPIALRLIGKGIAAIVVRYSVSPIRYPMQLLQISAAVALARRNSAEWHLDGDKISVMGFSAGGHAAASIGVLWQEEFIPEALGIEYGENKPNGMILCYPVISSGDIAHRGSFDNLLGEFKSPELLEKLSLEKQVTPNAPPAFLWHTANDGAVPVENTLMMASALQANGISFELHIYPDGVHGLSLCDDTTSNSRSPALINPVAAGWADLCIDWIKRTL